MAIKANECWMSSSGAIIAVKGKSGSYHYFINGLLLINNQYLQDAPAVAREISTLNLEIMEAKK